MNTYYLPPIDELYEVDKSTRIWKQEKAEELGKRLEELFASFKMDIKVVDSTFNPFAAILQLKIGPRIHVRTIKALRADIELAMRGPVEFIIKDGVFYIAVKLLNRPIVPLREIIESEAYQQASSKITVAAGIDLAGSAFVFDLAETPNLLVAGVTGSGKSVFLSDIILSILYKAKPDEVKFVMFDMKRVELTPFNGIPHMLMPTITETKDGINALKYLANETDKRDALLSATKKMTIDEYNLLNPSEKKPRIVVIIDEFMGFVRSASEDFNPLLKKIASRSKYTGIHLILATQRPTADVILPEIKLSIPCRAAFIVVDKRESRIIIDRTGAERLLGQGDFIFTRGEGNEAIHAQAAYVSYEEIDRLIEFEKLQTEIKH